MLVPEIVFVELDAGLARTEADPEISDLIKSSAGLNLALDYLPGSVMFNPVVDMPEEYLASLIVWFDAFVSNVDRTIRNTNMLMWHRRLWLIDHGASLYFHHTWENYLEKSREPFKLIKDLVLLKSAKDLKKADEELSSKLNGEVIKNIIDTIPDDWLIGDKVFKNPEENRNAYFNYLVKRMEHPHLFIEEAVREQ